jgi:YjjG family noncanonical pyrimidine nucleotidase
VSLGRARRYSWLWFDADGTLFDFESAEATALERALVAVGASFESRHLAAYRQINGELWQALERHEISPAVLPLRRFERLAEALALACRPAELSAAYIDQLAQRGELIDGAHEMVAALAGSHRIALVTNGLRTVQYRRLASSSIQPFISAVIVSEEVGAAKPKGEFFAAAFARTGDPPKGDVLVIGDSLSSDIQGGADYGLDTCWFNPAGLDRPPGLAITYEIARLGELRDLIG